MVMWRIGGKSHTAFFYALAAGFKYGEPLPANKVRSEKSVGAETLNPSERGSRYPIKCGKKGTSDAETIAAHTAAVRTEY